MQLEKLTQPSKNFSPKQNKYKHIYLRKNVANFFDSSRNFNEALIKDRFTALIDYFFSNIEELISFEGGIGTGSLGIPFLRAALQSHKKFILYGIDNSVPMLKILDKKVQKSFDILEHIYTNKFIYGFGDLEEKLYLPNSYFHIIVLGGVLHCLNNWKKALLQMKEILRPDGYLLIVNQNDEWTKIMSGYLEEDMLSRNRKIYEFWKHYYSFRKDLLGPLDERIRLVYDLSEVERFLGLNDFELADQSNISFKFTSSFGEYLRLIKEGLVTALGTGISAKDRRILAKVMEDWVLNNDLDVNETFHGIKNLSFTLWRRKFSYLIS